MPERNPATGWSHCGSDFMLLWQPPDDLCDHFDLHTHTWSCVSSSCNEDSSEKNCKVSSTFHLMGNRTICVFDMIFLVRVLCDFSFTSEFVTPPSHNILCSGQCVPSWGITSHSIQSGSSENSSSLQIYLMISLASASYDQPLLMHVSGFVNLTS